MPLSQEPSRVDYLLLRRVPEIPLDDPGETLRGLWPLLPKATIAELKTVGRPYRARNLDRLLAYLHLYFSGDDGTLETPTDLAGLLIVPDRTLTLDREIEERGLTWTDLGSGYAELKGGLFRLLVAEVDRVADGEDDDVLRLFGHEPELTREARQFWVELVGTKEAKMAVEALEDFYEVARRVFDSFPPEERLKGLTPEQIAGTLRTVPPDQLLVAMPDEVLRALSPDFVDALPEPARTTVKNRRGRG